MSWAEDLRKRNERVNNEKGKIYFSPIYHLKRFSLCVTSCIFVFTYLKFELLKNAWHKAWYYVTSNYFS